MTHLRLTAKEAAQIKKGLAEGKGPVLLEGPDGQTLAAAVAPGAFLNGPAYPESYFDCPPKITIEEAEKRFGIRPSKYFKGRPIFTEEEMSNPAFKWPYPPEDEWVAEVQAARKAEKSATLTQPAS